MGWGSSRHCEVLDVVPSERFAHGGKGGHAGNAGYGSLLDAVVTWTLSRTANGTRVRLVHAGFPVPGNEFALQTMGNGWQTVVPSIGGIADEQG